MAVFVSNVVVRDTWMLNCAYDCLFHRGKIEWHHPVAEERNLGLYLCEAHHSIIQGRKFKYAEELTLDKSLAEMKKELQALEIRVIEASGKAVSPNKN